MYITYGWPLICGWLAFFFSFSTVRTLGYLYLWYVWYLKTQCCLNLQDWNINLVWICQDYRWDTSKLGQCLVLKDHAHNFATDVLFLRNGRLDHTQASLPFISFPFKAVPLHLLSFLIASLQYAGLHWTFLCSNTHWARTVCSTVPVWQCARVLRRDSVPVCSTVPVCQCASVLRRASVPGHKLKAAIIRKEIIVD